MIKKVILSTFMFSFIFSIVVAQSSWEDALDQIETQEKIQEIQQVNENFNLQKFETQKQFEQFLIEILADKVVEQCKNRYYMPVYRGKGGGGMIMFDEMTSTQSIEKSLTVESLASDNIEYGKTNIQKAGIDEPEIIKLSSKFIIYYNKENGKIYIIKAPIDGDKLDVGESKILDEIKVPRQINKFNVKLFFQDNILIVFGTRYSNYFNGNVTDIVFYKIDNNGKAKFQRFYETRGDFKDARLYNGKIYLVNYYNFAPFVGSICDKFITVYDKRKIEQFYTQYLKADKISRVEYERQLKDYIDSIFAKIEKKQIIDQLTKAFFSKSIDIVYSPNKKIKIKNKVYPLDIAIHKPNLKNILYLPVDLTGRSLYDVSFDIVNIIDIKSSQPFANQYVIFGGKYGGQIHMSEKALYLVNSYYRSYPWKCGPALRCILPYYPKGNFTLIHKLSLNNFELNYISSQIVAGNPINQYSMDEDSKGNFRIFTKYRYPERATDLYVFDSNLHLIGSIFKIAPGEDFKSSRFIEDKAYLVTFKATDPLFVIDLANPSNPKIIGELKIPGYSLYLHPYGKFDSVQYLIGIGQEAEEIGGNWSLPKNIKIDLYEIDYSKISGDYIWVSQLYSYILGKETKVGHQTSYTPVFDNPRAFVMLTPNSANLNEKLLLLPVYLVEDKIEKKCNIIRVYKGSEVNGFDPNKFESDVEIIRGDDLVIVQKCYDYTQKRPYFIGVKGIYIDKDRGIWEGVSKNNIQIWKKYKNYYGDFVSRWIYTQAGPRASYYKIANQIAYIDINNIFTNIFDKEKDNYIYFQDIDEKAVSKQCYYTPPKPGTITCQMYCGSRWVLSPDGKSCMQVNISAACSCPGFDTKQECENQCVQK